MSHAYRLFFLLSPLLCLGGIFSACTRADSPSYSVSNYPLNSAAATANLANANGSTFGSNTGSSLGSGSNLAALGPSLKSLQAEWVPELRDGISWSLVEMSLENSVVPFQRSTQRLNIDLLFHSVSAQDSLTFARSLNAEYKSKAISILGLANQIGMETWGRDFFDSILQARPSFERLVGLERTLSSGLLFTAQEQARIHPDHLRGTFDGQFRGSSDSHKNMDQQEPARTELLTRALEENWNANQFEDLEMLLGIARLDHVCGKLPTRSLMVRCLGSSRFSKGENGFFAPSFGRRYSELAKDLIALDTGSDSSARGFSTMRTLIANAFFPDSGLLWSRCEGDQFLIKRALLRGSFRELATDNDDIRRSVMDRQIHDLLRDCSSAPGIVGTALAIGASSGPAGLASGGPQGLVSAGPQGLVSSGPQGQFSGAARSLGKLTPVSAPSNLKIPAPFHAKASGSDLDSVLR